MAPRYWTSSHQPNGVLVAGSAFCALFRYRTTYGEQMWAQIEGTIMHWRIAIRDPTRSRAASAP